MSRTVKSERATSPVQTHIFLNMKDGKFGKLDDSSEKIVNIEAPISFIPLDDKAFKIVGDKRVKGSEKRSIKSTLGHFEKKDVVKVYFNDTKHVIAHGKWSEIKNTVALEGGKAALQIFAYLPMEKAIAILAFRGRSYMEWINFCRENKLGNDPCATLAETKSAVTITGVKTIQDTSGDGADSFVPVFTLVKIGKQETLDAADAADATIQIYFDELFASEQAVDAAPVESTQQLAPSTAYVEQPRTQVPSTDYSLLVEDAPKQADDDDLPF